MPQAIQLICFDLGGVLIRLCDGWEHACALAGIKTTKPIGEAERARLVKLVEQEEFGALSSGAFFERAAPLLGQTPSEALAISDAWLCGAYPGIDGLIDAVHAAGLKTACLSNTNDNHWRAMSDPSHRNGLPLHKLHYCFASHLVKDRKPNRSIYEHVERETGLPPGAIVFFDDSLENVDAARAKGWQASQVTDPDNPAGQMTSYLKRHKLI